MYLKKLHISNFRCFRDYTIEFAPGVTVLFGKNGSGKTTLIHAIHKALSMLMYTKNIYESVLVKGEKKKTIKDYKSITNNNKYLHPKGFASDDFNNLEDAFIEVEATADFDQTLSDVNWKMSVKANSNKLRPTEFEEAFLSFYSWYENGGQLPLLTYISDCFPHKQDYKKSKVKAKIRELRNFAYFNWDEEEGCTNEWIKRLENNLKQQISLVSKGKVTQKTDGKFTYEIKEDDKPRYESLRSEETAIGKCFKDFSMDVVFTSPEAIKFKEFSLGKTMQNEGKLCIQTESGDEYAFRKLPAGYKRLFYIVLDLAYRSFILSKEGRTDIPGIVIIDEIDLHLHPQLEKVALNCLTKAFPKVQFIVSTHSPLVLTRIETEGKPNVILHMTPGTAQPEVTHDIYGIDYNSGIEDIMGVESKNVELDYLVNLCAYMRKRDKIAQADNVMKRIFDKFAKSRDEVEKMVEAKGKEL
ncbi:AAA family ATPase [Prevotella jejuni]|jgi:hypothetical protein|uniref:AAA family ATPase n=1 Tax=Prevotella jejuni TaxID=1177574 RepID=UPI00352F7DBE